MHRVLVSACLLGERVRHNGAHKRCVAIGDRCPELESGALA